MQPCDWLVAQYSPITPTYVSACGMRDANAKCFPRFAIFSPIFHYLSKMLDRTYRHRYEIKWEIFRKLFKGNYGGLAIGQTVAEIWRFFHFSKRRPSAILDLLCACLDHARRVYLVAFITVQNLVGINAVVSIICKC